MKKLLSLLFVLGLTLSACGTSQTQSAPPAQTSAPSLSPTGMITPTATQTPIPPTATVTPLPTIPTFTPTFDASTIVTVTPAEKAECPKANSFLKPDKQILFSRDGISILNETGLLDFLNSGGSPNTVSQAFIQEFNWFRPAMGIQQDITGDGVADFILNDSRVVYVLGCNNEKYQIWLSNSIELNRLSSIQFNIFDDLNLNGIPELITEIEGHGGFGYPYKTIFIFEWNGSEIVPLIQGEKFRENQFFEFAEMEFLPDVTFSDMDRNGVRELILESNAPSPLPQRYAHLIPWRNEKHGYSWNGTHFSLSRIDFTKPRYRFQAVQDAIFISELMDWSPAIAENEIAKAYAQDGKQPTPTPPAPDSTEYPRLAAYAYYRIMLLYLVQGRETEAASTYQTLQETFGDDPYAAPYVEMASAFWESYQSTHKMYDGCAVAIQYAVEHPEILIPLGSDYHGWQSHIYEPADVCPFR